MQVQMYGYTLNVVIKKYADPPNTAILLEMEDGEPFAHASYNPPILLDDGLVAIKDWSENAGMLEVLQIAGVVGEIVSMIPTGFVVAPVVPLLVKEG